MEIDKDIWLLIEKGDEKAYERMYIYYYKHFHIYGLKITTHLSLIEDTIQEIMIYIWHHRDSLPSIAHPAAYFYTSFRNLLIKNLRAQDLMVSNEPLREDKEESHEHTMVHQEEHHEMKEQLDRATNHLTARQKEAVFLRFYEGLSYDEVAEIMGITVKATYKIMARTLSELKMKYVAMFLFLQALLDLF